MRVVNFVHNATRTLSHHGLGGIKVDMENCIIAMLADKDGYDLLDSEGTPLEVKCSKL